MTGRDGTNRVRVAGNSYGRRRVLRAVGAGALAVGVAGCQSDRGADDPTTAPETTDDPDETTEPQRTTTADPTTHFLCPDIDDVPWADYDASGTPLLCDFERPAIFPLDRITVTNRGVRMERDLEGHQADAQVILRVRSVPGTGLRDPRETQGAVGTVSFDGYEIPVNEHRDTAERPLGRYDCWLPYTDEGTRFYRTAVELSVTLPPDRIPNQCALTVDRTAEEIATSITPNDETTFGDLRS